MKDHLRAIMSGLVAVSLLDSALARIVVQPGYSHPSQIGASQRAESVEGVWGHPSQFSYDNHDGFGTGRPMDAYGAQSRGLDDFRRTGYSDEYDQNLGASPFQSADSSDEIVSSAYPDYRSRGEYESIARGMQYTNGGQRLDQMGETDVIDWAAQMMGVRPNFMGSDRIENSRMVPNGYRTFDLDDDYDTMSHGPYYHHGMHDDRMIYDDGYGSIFTRPSYPVRVHDRYQSLYY